jgi:hypothetical protein
MSKLIDQVDRYLARCLRAALDQQHLPAWPADWSDAATHDLTALRVQFHGIAVVLGAARDGIAGWPHTVADCVHEEMRLAAIWEETHRRRVVALIAALAAEDIAAMVMKGTALAYMLYPDPAMRRRGDTDLLITPTDLDRTRKVLRREGFYRREDPLGLNYQESWLVDCGAGMVHMVDLHWQPTDRPVLQRLLKAERFWTARVPVPRLSPHVTAPDPITLLVHVAINQAWHEAHGFNVDGAKIVGGKRLIWAMDYLLITAGYSDEDWQALADFCVAHDAAAIVKAALDGARDSLGLEVPVAAQTQLDRAAVGSETLAYIRQPGIVREFKRDLAAARSPLVKLRLLLNLGLPPRTHLVQKYPHRAHWPTGLLHLNRWSEAIMRWRSPENRL